MKKETKMKKTLATLMLLIGALLVSVAGAQAATYTVTNTNDSGVGSLRAAIAAASTTLAANVINFDATAFAAPQTIKLTSGQLEIASNVTLTIDGTSANRLSISGNNTSRVFYINLGAVLTINNLTVTQGNAGNGGGIYNYSGTLNLTKSTVSGNSADFTGGGIYNFLGTLSLANATVSNNSATFGGIGGGIYNYSGTLTLTNATVSGNSADYGGGIRNDGGTVNAGNSIIAANTATSFAPDFSGTVISQGYNLVGIVDGSTGFTAAGDKVGTSAAPLDPKLGPLAYNGGQTPTLACPFPCGLNSAFNGGRTQTLALLPGSPAIDAGNSILTTDQRGFPRPVDFPSIPNAAGGNGSDIGAFEVQQVVADQDNDGIPDSCDIDQNPGATDFDRDGVVDSSACDTKIGPPQDKEQCKNGGWMRFNFPRTFKNQGDCIQFVNTGK